MKLSEDQKKLVKNILQNVQPSTIAQIKTWTLGNNVIKYNELRKEYNFNFEGNQVIINSRNISDYKEIQNIFNPATKSAEESSLPPESSTEQNTDINKNGESYLKYFKNAANKLLKKAEELGEGAASATKTAINYGTDKYFQIQLYEAIAKNRDLSFAMAIKRGGPDFLVDMGIVDVKDKDTVKTYTNALSMAIAAKCVRYPKLS